MAKVSRNQAAADKETNTTRHPLYSFKLREKKVPDAELSERLAEAGRQQRPKKRRYTIAIMLVAATLAGIGWVVFNNKPAQSPQNQRLVTIQNIVDFPLYYPGSLPPGYALDYDTLSTSGGNVTFNIRTTSGEQWFFAEQRKPKNFDFDFSHSKQLQNTRQLDTPVGRAFIGSSKDRQGLLTVSMVAEPTWLLITVPESVSHAQLNRILMDLRTVKD